MAALEISSHPPSPIRQIEDARLERLKQAPSNGPHAMVRLLARVIGVGVETADMLVQEVLSRNMRDRRAIARWPLQASFFLHYASSRYALGPRRAPELWLLPDARRTRCAWRELFSP
jgi:hypothetical protein